MGDRIHLSEICPKLFNVIRDLEEPENELWLGNRRR
jgi:hypothetical protein